MEYNELQDLCEKLSEYTRISNDEVSEVCDYLIEISNYTYVLSEEFIKSLTNEIKSQLKNYMDNSEIVERKETLERVTKELIWT